MVFFSVSSKEEGGVLERTLLQNKTRLRGLNVLWWWF